MTKLMSSFVHGVCALDRQNVRSRGDVDEQRGTCR